MTTGGRVLTENMAFSMAGSRCPAEANCVASGARYVPSATTHASVFADSGLAIEATASADANTGMAFDMA